MNDAWDAHCVHCLAACEGALYQNAGALQVGRRIVAQRVIRWAAETKLRDPRLIRGEVIVLFCSGTSFAAVHHTDHDAERVVNVRQGVQMSANGWRSATWCC